jgi:hypothetical protein
MNHRVTNCEKLRLLDVDSANEGTVQGRQP